MPEEVFGRGVSTKTGDGRGIGLALVRAVCVRRGGEVAVRSAPGRARCSRRVCRDRRGPSMSGSEVSGSGPVRVLVVDDDFMVAKVHGGFVGRTPGFVTVGVAHHGAEALAEGRRAAPRPRPARPLPARPQRTRGARRPPGGRAGHRRPHGHGGPRRRDGAGRGPRRGGELPDQAVRVRGPRATGCCATRPGGRRWRGSRTPTSRRSTGSSPGRPPHRRPRPRERGRAPGHHCPRACPARPPTWSRPPWPPPRATCPPPRPPSGWGSRG